MSHLSYRRHRFPAPIIQHAIWLYLRFTLSYRDVEHLLAERGLDLSYETVRRWVLKFGSVLARRLKERRPRPSDRWHQDEVVVRIARQQMYLWRAVDHEDEIPLCAGAAPARQARRAASTAAIFWAAGDQNAMLSRDDVEPLGFLLADHMHAAAAARAQCRLQLDHHLDARQMRGQRFARAGLSPGTGAVACFSAIACSCTLAISRSSRTSCNWSGSSLLRKHIGRRHRNPDSTTIRLAFRLPKNVLRVGHGVTVIYV